MCKDMTGKSLRGFGSEGSISFLFDLFEGRIRRIQYVATFICITVFCAAQTSTDRARMDRIPDTHISYTVEMDIHEGKLAEFKKYIDLLFEKIQADNGILYYNIAYNADQTKCIFREGYKSGQAVLDHCQDVTAEISKFIEVSDCTRVLVMGPAKEWAVAKPSAEPFEAFELLQFWETSENGSMNRNVDLYSETL